MDSLLGYVSIINKNDFEMLFDRDGKLTLSMKFKKKKLSLAQKELLSDGLIVKLDFGTKKMYFKTIEGEWI